MRGAVDMLQAMLQAVNSQISNAERTNEKRMFLQRRRKLQERKRGQEWLGREHRDFAFVCRSGRLTSEIAVSKICPKTTGRCAAETSIGSDLLS